MKYGTVTLASLVPRGRGQPADIGDRHAGGTLSYIQLLPGTGHVPQIETPSQLNRPIWDFASLNQRR